jgi:hypothetical protein
MALLRENVNISTLADIRSPDRLRVLVFDKVFPGASRGQLVFGDAGQE